MKLDEAGRCPVPNLPDYFSTVTGRKMSISANFQSPSQMEELYGRFGAHTIRENCDSHIFYRPGSDETAAKASNGLGEKTEWSHSQSHTGDHTSEGMMEKTVALMTAQAIRRLDDDEVIIRHRNMWPINARRMDWQHYPVLVARRNIAAPPVRPIPDHSEPERVDGRMFRYAQVRQPNRRFLLRPQ